MSTATLGRSLPDDLHSVLSAVSVNNWSMGMSWNSLASCLMCRKTNQALTSTDRNEQVHGSGLLPLIGATLSRLSSARGWDAAGSAGQDDLNVACHIVTFYVTAAPGTLSGCPRDTMQVVGLTSLCSTGVKPGQALTLS